MRGIAAIVLLSTLSTGISRAGIIMTVDLRVDSHASFTYQGTPYQQSQSVDTVSFSSSQALAGTANTPEARTAARLGGNEIAVNARLDGKHLFGGTDIQDNASTAIYTGTIEKISGPAEHILMDFLLPKSYVETTLNVEFPRDEVQSVMSAWIDTQPCTDFLTCGGPITRVFDFQAYLIDTYLQDQQLAHATGQAGLDVSPLLNPTFTDTTSGSGFQRTRHLEFAPFLGTVDLGVMSVGEILQFQYEMQVRSTGIAASTVGIVSINDPFFVDSDPVTLGAPVLISTVPAANAVPEPGTIGLVAAALAASGLAAARRRSHTH